MEFVMLACFVICPFTFIYFLMKSIYQTIRQANRNSDDQKFQNSSAVILAGLSLMLLMLSTYVLTT